MNLRRIFLIVLPLLFLALALFVAVTTKKRTENNIASVVSDYSGEIDPGAKEGVWEGKKVAVPDEILSMAPSPVLGVTSEDRWIEVDLGDQKLIAREGNSVFLETAVSSGLPWTPTPTGEFRIWIKLRATKMEGGEGKYYYYLPNVPYVMFFANDKVPSWRGYGLHGTYWHNDFGRPHSHGCVNLPTPVAEKLYHWTSPSVPAGKNIAYADDNNPGTKIIIHN